MNTGEAMTPEEEYQMERMARMLAYYETANEIVEIQFGKRSDLDFRTQQYDRFVIENVKMLLKYDEINK